MSTDKTLADVQPGGRVRLGDQLPPLPCTHYNACGDGSEPLYTSEQMRDYARAALSAQPSPVAYHGDVDLKWLSGSIGEVAHRLSTYMPTGLAEWADRARDCRIAAQVLSELSAQPSLGGQGAAIEAMAESLLCAESSATLEDAREQAALLLADALPHLSARQPVEEPVGYATYRDGRFGSWLFQTRAMAESHDSTAVAGGPANSEIVPLFRSPAQAVDLGQFRRPIEEWRSDMEKWVKEHGDPRGAFASDLAEADRLLALIDSHSGVSRD